ncbi:tyrosine-type recombinase/integrase [Paraburkholderia sp. CNPSo 3281]|uniref:tyrosine-type recombinase/integrase n=1 Tax=Paraburkholderia sp. CNPSo 3281 TaxID=2940933 RepID=UPI0020B682E6|nr:tyrosine-type recombinase/integrase [Paraburkholderia sp. CNPSo 3281]MCP3717058.1 tyrosine-type recombinase/integrase [Paraburkholderia sp. CNPSo 3281]
MAKSNILEAQLTMAKGMEFAGVVVHSKGEYLELTTPRDRHPIYSVTDSRGAVVRTAHEWLRSLTMTEGLSNTLSTAIQYGHTVTYLVRWIERNGPFPDLSVDENIVRLEREHIRDWLQDMRRNGAHSHGTRHSREACIRSFLEWLTTHDAGLVRRLEDSPYGRDNTLRYLTASPTARSPKFIPAEVVVEVLSRMYNECERCMFHVQFDTGLRISEVVNLAQGDIPDASMYNSSFEFIPLCARRVKGRGGQRPEKATLISRAALNRVKRYHNSLEYKLAPDWDIDDPDKPAFLTANQLKWSPRNASKQFKNAVNRANVSKHMSPHWLRHGTAFSVLRSDIGKTYEDRILIVQQMLGHAHLTTTEIYTQISPAMLQRLTKEGEKQDRLKEAEFIRSHTFLGPLQHKEKRGHHA